MILLLSLFLSLGSIQAGEIQDLSAFEDISEPENKTETVLRQISEKTFYYYLGTALESVSLFSRLGGAVCYISPWAPTIGNECLLLSHLCHRAAERVFAQMFKESPSFAKIPLSQKSWYLNQKVLSQIPAHSQDEKQLLHFLEKRWLSKATGFFSSVIDWICPCFGISIQVHPDTTSCYARDPSIKFSQTYKNRVEDWKQFLPHPQEFPLILTRPFDVRHFLPSCIEIPTNEKVSQTVEKLASILKTIDAQIKDHSNANFPSEEVKLISERSVIIDLSQILSVSAKQEEWLKSWKAYSQQFSQACKERNLDFNRILCIQKMQRGSIGGIRLLPLGGIATDTSEQHYQFLLKWISKFGISANQIELDRWTLSSNTSESKHLPLSIETQSKDTFLSYLNSFEQNWKSKNPQKTLMMKATLQVLAGLFDHISDEKWEEISNCPTRSSLVQLSFSRIKQQLHYLAKEKEETLFFDTVGHIEHIHADLSSLLEIFAPFSADDFPLIYQALNTSIPKKLKPLTSYALHASGMTSLGGILKAMETTLGTTPRVLYGENTYFECINAVHLVSKASPIQEATEQDWKEVDLIIAQYNPVLKRIDMQVTDYKVERVEEFLHKSFIDRKKPLTIALDCTFDFIDSTRVGRLLEEFHKEIQKGLLNVICYRSGLKFDLFGMDNYSGAPLTMIHNQDSHWSVFDSLLNDPALQTDRLSLNWFCLAYNSAAPELELYRKQIFDNTRAFLSKVPSRLLNDKKAHYRIIPVEKGADPAFIDIKVSGPFHQIRSATLVGGSLFIKCMEGGHPIFYRPSLGFYHANFTMLFSKDCSTIRLTLGLDPDQIELLVKCFETIDALNGSIL